MTNRSGSIFDLGRKYSESCSPELYKEWIALQSKLNFLSTNQAEYLLLRTRSTYYEYGEKACWLLAHQLKRQTASRLIPQVRDQDQYIVTNPKEINNTFATFYSTLNTSEFPSDVMNMNSFLDNLELPTIEPGDREGTDLLQSQRSLQPSEICELVNLQDLTVNLPNSSRHLKTNLHL